MTSRYWRWGIEGGAILVDVTVVTEIIGAGMVLVGLLGAVDLGIDHGVWTKKPTPIKIVAMTQSAKVILYRQVVFMVSQDKAALGELCITLPPVIIPDIITL